jgi:mono/diheme cytochrome c family protein
MPKKNDILMSHDYDGIQELDNDLPTWWLWLFYLTIIFSIVYLMHYHVIRSGDLMIAEYEKELNPELKSSAKTASITPDFLKSYHSPFYNPSGDVSPKIRAQFDEFIGPKIDFNTLIAEAMVRANEAELQKLQTAFPEIWEQLASAGGDIVRKPVAEATAEAEPKELIAYEALTDEASLQAGQDIYIKYCLTCHGSLGEGGIGPNMTDDYWLHGAGVSNVVNVIKTGVPAKGMISWRGVLNENQMLQVASYILTLHGTNPPNAKNPQGEKVEYPLQ